MKVCVCCSQPVLADGLAVLLGELDGAVVCAVFDSIEGLAAGLHAGELAPDLVIVEVAPVITLDRLAEIFADAGDARIVLWVKSAPAEFLSQALMLGPRGMIDCGSSRKKHLDCLRAVMAGELWIEQELGFRLAASSHVRLTARQRDVMGLLAQGLKNKEIAYQMGISTGTVKVYLSRLFRITKTADRLELALLGLKNLASDPQRLSGRSVAPGDARPSFPSMLTRESANRMAA